MKKKVMSFHLLLIVLVISFTIIGVMVGNQNTAPSNESNTNGDAPIIPIQEEHENIFSGDCLAKGGELINLDFESCTTNQIELSDQENNAFVCCI
jgi:hypothetical protein